MKQRLLKRTKDYLFGQKNPLAKLSKLLSTFGETEVLRTVRNEWNRIEYVVEETTDEYIDYSEWDLSLTGIRLPLYEEPAVSNAVSDVFTALVKSVGIEPDYSKPGIHLPCYYSENRKMFGGFKTPVIDAKSLSDANEKARKVIDAYIEHREGIERSFKEIDRVYPITWQETKLLLPKLKEQFALDFLII